MRKNRLNIFIVIGLIGVFTVFLVNYNSILNANELTDVGQIRLFNEVLSKIRASYAEADKTEMDVLIEGAIKGMIETLDDPYTQYMPPKKYDDVKQSTEGEYGGLGIYITIRDKILTIVSPIAGTPAARENIMPNDKIIKIEGELTEGIELSDAASKMRGKPGTDVTITIKRDSVKEPFDITITREKIEIPNVSFEMIDDKIAYLKLIQFNEHTVSSISNALNELKKNGMESLILDLRNNPGGLFNASYGAADLFLDEGLIVYTQGRDEKDRKDFYASKHTPYKDIPLLVLVNKGSASSSEILTGALKDNKRAVVIGENTFGKGHVQTVFPLSSGAVSVTTAVYYTPSGSIIHNNGIAPDVYVKAEEQDIKVIEGFYKAKELTEFIDYINARKEFKKEQIKEVDELLKKKEINVPDYYLEYLIKSQFAAKEGKMASIDLQIDNQLRYAADLLKTSFILNRK